MVLVLVARLGSAEAEGSSISAQRVAHPNPSSTKLHCSANGIENRILELQAMAEVAAGAMAGGCDGLTEAILLEAEIAATRRLDWRMALENMTAVLKSLMRLLCNQLRLMQEGRRGEVDGVGDGALRKRLERSPGRKAQPARRR
jgi:hypothetical protein